MTRFPLFSSVLLAGSILSPLPAIAVMPVSRDPLILPMVEMVQFRNNGGNNFRSGNFNGDSLSRAQVYRPPVGRPSTGKPPKGERPSDGRPPSTRPPSRPDGGPWGRGPVIYPDYYPRPRPPVVIVDDDEDYVPRPPRRRPRPVIEDIDDEPVIRRRPKRRIAAPVAPARASTRPAIAQPPIVRPPLTVARRLPPRLPPVLVPRTSERRLVNDEVLVELKEGVTAETVARRHRLTALSTERFTLANVSIVRFRVDGNRSARQALAAMAGDARIAEAQPNFIYALQQEAKPEEGGNSISNQPAVVVPAVATPADPMPSPSAIPVETVAAVQRKDQYSLGKMGIPAAHQISKGNRIRVVVIDTAVDDLHPELNGVVSRRFDAIGSGVSGSGETKSEVPVDNHGTAIAGAIIAKSALQGISPAAELLVARAFTGGIVKAGSGAEGTTLHILKSLDWAHAEGARVVNLSFAGPQDRLLSRSLLGVSAKGMIAVAAAGNGGPNSQPLFPGADPSVIAVTATDANDKIFAQANTGSYVAVAAPGVDVITAEPGSRYSFSSGTSVAAAHVSGLIALMLEQKSDLDLASVRIILNETSQDLGAKGHDKVFGAGRIDAPAALARTIKADAARSSTLKTDVLSKP